MYISCHTNARDLRHNCSPNSGQPIQQGLGVIRIEMNEAPVFGMSYSLIGFVIIIKINQAQHFRIYMAQETTTVILIRDGHHHLLLPLHPIPDPAWTCVPEDEAALIPGCTDTARHLLVYNSYAHTRRISTFSKTKTIIYNRSEALYTFYRVIRSNLPNCNDKKCMK